MPFHWCRIWQDPIDLSFGLWSVNGWHGTGSASAFETSKDLKAPSLVPTASSWAPPMAAMFNVMVFLMLPWTNDFDVVNTNFTTKKCPKMFQGPMLWTWTVEGIRCEFLKHWPFLKPTVFWHINVDPKLLTFYRVMKPQNFCWWQRLVGNCWKCQLGQLQLGGTFLLVWSACRCVDVVELPPAKNLFCF